MHYYALLVCCWCVCWYSVFCVDILFADTWWHQKTFSERLTKTFLKHNVHALPVCVCLGDAGGQEHRGGIRHRLSCHTGKTLLFTSTVVCVIYSRAQKFLSNPRIKLSLFLTCHLFVCSGISVRCSGCVHARGSAIGVPAWVPGCSATAEVCERVRHCHQTGLWHHCAQLHLILRQKPCRREYIAIILFSYRKS